MQKVLVFLILSMFAANVSQAFEIDGLKSGISMDQAKNILATYSYKNEVISKVIDQRNIFKI